MRRRAYEILALLLLVGFFFVHHRYWVPANGGVDQHGYLVGGKMFAQKGSTRFEPINPVTGKHDPFMFVGMMWFGTDLGTAQERFYPKYGIGLPVLVAAALKLGGREYGPELAYWINPVAMTCAMVATFLLIRFFAGSFAGIMGMIIVATGPVVLGLTNNPNSHATATCCAAWGMYLLLRWWQQTDGWWRGIVAGFLLGYGMTIRYTEVTLLAPIVLVVLFKLWPSAQPAVIWSLRWCGARLSVLAERVRARGQVPCVPPPHWFKALGEPCAAPRGWFDRKQWLQCAATLAAWAVPVGFLACFNLGAFGSLTGYDPFKESVGFSWDYFDENWETMLRHMNGIGLFFLFPLGIMGLFWMFSWSWRVASVMAAWIVPNLWIYALYYWAPDGTGIGYLRFFLTIFPGLGACAFWMLAQLVQSPVGATPASPSPTVGGSRATQASPLQQRPQPSARIVWPAMLGVLTCVAVLVNFESSLPALEGEQRGNLMLNRAAREARGFGNVPGVVPPGSVIFGSDHLLDHLQFVGDWHCYSADSFNMGFIRRWIKNDPDDPHPFQAQRSKFLFEMLKNHNEQEFVKEQQKCVTSLLDGGKRVFFFVPRNGLTALKLRFAPTRLENPDLFEVKTVAGWNDPNVRPPPRKPPSPQPRRKKYEPPMADPKLTMWYIVEVRLRSYAGATLASPGAPGH